MKKNNSFLFLILISFLFICINSKRCKACEECSNSNNKFIQDPAYYSPIGFKTENKYYHLENKNINITRDKLKLSMKFIGINNLTSEPNFNVNYTVNFYDKEKVGIDEIQAELTGIKPLYSFSILRNKPESDMEWGVEIKKNDEKEQIAQIIAKATFNDIQETFAYNSFRFTYSENDKEKEDRKFEFWIIFCCFLGIIVITFIGLYVYIYSTLEIGRNTLIVNNLSTANFDESAADEGTRTTA